MGIHEVTFQMYWQMVGLLTCSFLVSQGLHQQAAQILVNGHQFPHTHWKTSTVPCHFHCHWWPSEYLFLSNIYSFLTCENTINVVECKEFHWLLLLLQQDLKDLDIPHQANVHEDVVIEWKKYFTNLWAKLAVGLVCCKWYHILNPFLQLSCRHISHTVDIWSNNNWHSFLAVTAHWIAKDPSSGSLKLRSALLAFHQIHGDHTSQSLAKIVLHLLDRAKTTAKIGTNNYIIGIKLAWFTTCR